MLCLYLATSHNRHTSNQVFICIFVFGHCQANIDMYRIVCTIVERQAGLVLAPSLRTCSGGHKHHYININILDTNIAVSTSIWWTQTLLYQHHKLYISYLSN